MDWKIALITTVLFVCAVGVLNCLYGLALSLNGPLSCDSNATQRQRWFVAGFGLQWALVVWLERWVEVNHKERSTMLGIGVFALIIAIMLVTRDYDTSMVVLGLIGLYIVSMVAARMLQPSVFPDR